MKIIDLSKVATVEVWPGRRLYFATNDGVQLVALPKGQMSQLGTTVSFGNVGRTTVRLEGSARMAKAIALAIIEQEMPTADVVRKVTAGRD